MTAFYRGLRSFCGVTCKAGSVSKLNDLLRSNVVRQSATDVKAVTIRTVRGTPKKNWFDVGSLILLVIPAGAFGLGTWQVFRKFEKDKINNELLEKTKQPVIDLPKNLDDLQDLEFCSVRVKGRFDHSREFYVGPRPLIYEDSLTRPISLISNTKTGYLVFTPFILSDRDLTILVNRGWVPVNKKSPNTRQEGQITGEVELVGLVRNHDSRKPFGSKNVPEKGFWTHRDLVKMAECAGTAPVLLDAVASTTVPGGPIGGQTLVQFRNDHVSYIATWYSLCVASGYMWYVWQLQRRPIRL